MYVLQGFEGFVFGKYVLRREKISMLGPRDGLYIPEPSRLCLEEIVLNGLSPRRFTSSPSYAGSLLDTVGCC